MQFISNDDGWSGAEGTLEYGLNTEDLLTDETQGRSALRLFGFTWHFFLDHTLEGCFSQQLEGCL